MEDKSRENRNFVQLYRPYIDAMESILDESLAAHKVLMFIIKHMDNNNALCVSMKALQEILGYSRQTLSKAVKYLKENGWLCVMKSGTSNIYIINPEVAWTSYGSQKMYCKFHANVIVTPSENAEYLNNAKASTKYKHIDDTFIESVKASKQAFEARAAEIKQDGNAVNFDEETGEILENDYKEEEPYYED